MVGHRKCNQPSFFVKGKAMKGVIGCRPLKERLARLKEAFNDLKSSRDIPVEASWERLEALEAELVPGRLVLKLGCWLGVNGVSYVITIGNSTGGIGVNFASDYFFINAAHIFSQTQHNGRWHEEIIFHEKDIDFMVPDSFLVGARLPTEKRELCCEFFVTKREIHEHVRTNDTLRMALISSRLYCERILR